MVWKVNGVVDGEAIELFCGLGFFGVKRSEILSSLSSFRFKVHPELGVLG